MPGRVLASSGTFQYFAAAAPGAKELVSMVKVWELTRDERWRRRAGRYDLVVLDAPATGHALGLLHSPRTFGAIARVGPIFGQAEQVRALLEDSAQTSYLAVTQPTEIAVGETLDLQAGLRSQLERELTATIVNATLPRRFDRGELAQMERLDGSSADQALGAARSAGRARAGAHPAQPDRAPSPSWTDGAQSAVRVRTPARPRRHPVDRRAPGSTAVSRVSGVASDPAVISYMYEITDRRMRLSADVPHAARLGGVHARPRRAAHALPVTTSPAGYWTVPSRES